MKTIITAALITFVGVAAQAGPDANGPAGFTTDWHGHGDNHQGNNDPGDTAADRHGFGDADAGGSGKSPSASTNAGKKK